MSSSNDKLWKAFWNSVERWHGSNPKPSIAVERSAAGDNWPEAFKATVHAFSQENKSVSFKLETGEVRDFDLRRFNIRGWSAPRPGRDLAEWNTVKSFRLFRESEEFFDDEVFVFTEFRELGRKI
jgi:hypothetical protein